MSTTRVERWGAASGIALLAMGAAAAAIDAGTVSANDPVATISAYFTGHRTTLLVQSLLFAVGAGIFLWFLATLRGFLAHAEGDAGTLSGVAFGAGVAWVAISLAAQSFQVGLALTADGASAQPAIVATMWALFTVASIPLAAMLLATAAVTLSREGFPRWFGWLSLIAGVAQLAVLTGFFAETGPLSPTGWVTYGPYPVYAAWLLAATSVMLSRGHRRAPSIEIPDTAQEFLDRTRPGSA